VEMTNEAEAERAIAALNGKDVSGRALNVNEAGQGGRGPRPGAAVAEVRRRGVRERDSGGVAAAIRGSGRDPAGSCIARLDRPVDPSRPE